MVVGAREPFGEPPALAGIDEVGDDQAVGKGQGRLDRFGQPLLHRLLDLEPVDDDVDGVLLLLVQLGWLVGEVMRLAVDQRPAEPRCLELAEELAVLALAAADDRRDDLEARAFLHRQDAVDDLLGGLARDGLAALGAMRAPGTGVEKAQVVVDLGDGADGRPRVAAGRLLVDGHRRRQTFDEVDIGLVHLAEELAGVRAQRFDVAALPLGEDRVERQRGLSRAGETGEHDEGVPRKIDGDVLQVVLARPANNQPFGHPINATDAP